MNNENQDNNKIEDNKNETTLSVSQILNDKNLILLTIAAVIISENIILFLLQNKRNTNDTLLFLSLISTFFGILCLLTPFFIKRNLRERTFLDIDKEKIEKSLPKNSSNQEQTYIMPASSFVGMHYSFFHDFSSYFQNMIIYIDNQIILCDQKASILLEKGKQYAIVGIIGYGFFIFIWQILFLIFDYNIKFILCILSTSLLFIFIEFFSAWFLRQYKQYVDTSTYLIKIKSILQRYVLAYFALKDAREKDFDASPIISMLQEEIKWPETYLTKNPDVNFAKECLETATELIKSLQTDAKKNEK